MHDVMCRDVMPLDRCEVDQLFDLLDVHQKYLDELELSDGEKQTAAESTYTVRDDELAVRDTKEDLLGHFTSAVRNPGIAALA